MELNAPNIKQDLEDLEYWIVGGAVRDKMLDKEPKDRDYVVVGATADGMENRGFKPVEASNFPVFKDSNNDEWALARKERKIDEGYHGFETFTEDVSLEEDLARRDFTINAMAYNPEKDVFDYPVAVEENYKAHSVRDLKQKNLRHITDAFEEDPVRILRLARFASRLPEFTIADKTMVLAQENSNKLENVPGERITQEIKKAMAQAEDPVRFWNVMKETGALKVILPEIDDFDEISAGPEKYHGEGDLWSHTKMVMGVMQDIDPNNVEKLLMAVFHDIGKVETKKEGNSGGHDVLGVDIVEEIAKDLRFSNELEEKLKDACREHMRIFNVDPRQRSSMTPGKVIELVERLDGSKGATQKELIDLAKADTLGRITENPTDKSAFDRINKRLEKAREAVETVDAEYVTSKRGKEIKDYEGEAIGQMITQDRIEYLKKE